MKKLKTISIASLCALLVIFAAIAFNRKVTPSQLELQWEQRIDRHNAAQISSNLSPDMVTQLTQISAYRLSKSITHSDQQSKTVFRLVFNDAISIDETKALMPKLRAIFKDLPFQMTFRGQQETYSVGLFDAMFARVLSSKATFRITVDDTTSVKSADLK